jgi:hypothetical protein
MVGTRFGRAMGAGILALAVAATMAVVTQLPARPAAKAAAHDHGNATSRRDAADALRLRMRKLWEDHITWTRMFIVSAVAELPDVDAAATRLLANQDHIGDAIKPFYGKKASERLSALLREHILIAADLVTAAKAGDEAAVEEANTRWHRNATDIADFLHAANPRNWPRSETRSMMADHLELTLEEAVARLNGDWDGDVKAYDRIHRQVLHMADMLSKGIIRQFPDRFSTLR